MDYRKIIQERIQQRVAGLDLGTNVNATVAANVGKNSQTTIVSSTSGAVRRSPLEVGAGAAVEMRAQRLSGLRSS